MGRERIVPNDPKIIILEHLGTPKRLIYHAGYIQDIV